MPYDQDELISRMRKHITREAANNMPDPITLTVKQRAAGTGYVWASRASSTVRCRVPDHWNLSVGDVILALPPNPGDPLGLYLGVMPLWSSGDAGRQGRLKASVYSTANVSNPPTDAELDSTFGTPATVGASFTCILDDNGSDANVYFVASNGTSWWYVALTKAV